MILVDAETITARCIVMPKHTLARTTTSLKDVSLLSRIILSLQRQNCQKSNLYAVFQFALHLLSTSVIWSNCSRRQHRPSLCNSSVRICFISEAAIVRMYVICCVFAEAFDEDVYVMLPLNMLQTVLRQACRTHLIHVMTWCFRIYWTIFLLF